jgi:hypothetical protein
VASLEEPDGHGQAGIRGAFQVRVQVRDEWISVPDMGMDGWVDGASSLALCCVGVWLFV